MKVGDQIPTWFSGRADGLSTVLALFPYTGRYPEHFTHVAKLTAPRTNAGTLEMSVDLRAPMTGTMSTCPGNSLS